MRHVADRFTVILDANVLYPFLVRDVLLTFAEAGLYRPLWSAKIMDEWIAGLLEKKPHLAANVAKTRAQIEKYFPEAAVDRFEDLIPSLTLPDPNDRHVLAAAIRGDAHAIITENLKDFPEDVLSQYDIEALSADDFLLNTFQLYPSEAVAALRKMRTRYKVPPMDAPELVSALIRAGLIFTASELRAYLGTA
jgi:predicted nucleic acid-binding protein